jgi:hypothetical protein
MKLSDDYLLQAAVAAWASRSLPARLDAPLPKLLGFAEHDNQILLRLGSARRWATLHQCTQMVSQG